MIFPTPRGKGTSFGPVVGEEDSNPRHRDLINENRWRNERSGRGNKVQVYRSVRMPQLHTSLHFHLTPIVMINACLADLQNSQKLVAPSRRGREPCRCLGCATGSSGEVGIGEHSSWGPFRCFQQLSAPHLATQRLPWAR
ncbi:hypothetical protein HAX54_027145 [Datura stramonium]|uniref:Uncharacterized protein n=1 Tax=Datura stramonium TaxID=4076 RepID=A0ABS8V4V9_DATST|nr:hypothetical protein [Datura stramonium]